jgi:23S rRNA pseudouridine955/2504/2580 synthase
MPLFRLAFSLYNIGMALKNIPLVYENDCLLVFDKPAGLAVQGGKGIKVSLDSLLAENYEERPLLVHRLDRDTSGLIMVAKNRGAASLLQGLFAARGEGGRALRKYYTAMCAGAPEKEEGVIRIALNVKGRELPSETSYRLLSQTEAGGSVFSKLELELGTGRMHQIRRHLSISGCPIIGDDKYGDFALNRKMKKLFGIGRLLLHASRLSCGREKRVFIDGLEVTSPLPDCFSLSLDKR